MTFAATRTADSNMGDKRVCYGTYTQNNADTGGAITTGLSVCEYIGATGMTKVTISGGTATIVTADPGGDQTGYWFAFGR